MLKSTISQNGERLLRGIDEHKESSGTKPETIVKPPARGQDRELIVFGL